MITETNLAEFVDIEEFLRKALCAVTSNNVESLLGEIPIVPEEDYMYKPEAPEVGWQEGKFHWVPVGKDRGNAGRIKLAHNPINPIAERLINGMEALIELSRQRELEKDSMSLVPNSPREAVKRYFRLPHLDQIYLLDDEQERKSLMKIARDLARKLRIRLVSDKPTGEFSVIIEDEGIGQTPENIHKTLLSLGATTKGDKPYLIGVFGQGGASAYSACQYSWVLSRQAQDFTGGSGRGVGWTVIKHIFPSGRRDDYFAYLAAHPDGRAPFFSEAVAEKVGIRHGTRFAHINYNFGRGGAQVVRRLFPALNHVLFNPIIPYELYAARETADLMSGNAYRLSRLSVIGSKPVLDKTFDKQEVLNSGLSGQKEGYGHISVRVVVLQKLVKNLPVTVTPEGDGQEEPLVDTGKTPVSSYLEEPKRGRQCAVFLVYGQRQHGWDNAFIQQELEFKYLRNRMMVIVDVDELKNETIAKLMQGSRHQFYEGTEYETIRSRVLAMLKEDPDLKRLETEAEEEIYELKSGDEAVKKALDKLIEEHHSRVARTTEGVWESGKSIDEDMDGVLDTTKEVVVKEYPEIGDKGNEPVLIVNPEVYTIRLRPNETKRLTLTSQPVSEWRNLGSVDLRVEPIVEELSVVHDTLSRSATIDLTFNEPENWDEDEYPIETNFRVLARFSGKDEPRMVERRIIINSPKKKPPKPLPILLDEPTYLKVLSRQPIKFHKNGPDVHVRLQWDGKDYLATGEKPLWSFEAKCTSDNVSPPMTFSNPKGGKMELLIQVPSEWAVEDKMKFEVAAFGQNGRLLFTSFEGEVINPPEPRKIGSVV